MNAAVFSLRDLPEDRPIDLLVRRKLEGERILFAHIRLAAGCRVEPHRHDSEQVSFLLNGRVRWTFGNPGDEGDRVVDIDAGNVVLVPSNAWHGVEALEDSEIVDILSPPAQMGVDRQA